MRPAGRDRRPRARLRGSAVLYAVVLSPVLLVSLALAVQLGALQLQRERLRSAVDEAAVVAATRAASMTRAGIGLDAGAAQSLMRTALIDNLSSFQDQFSGVSAAQIAESAEIYPVVDVPARDPFDPPRILVRPTLVARVRVPLATGLLTLAHVPSTVTLTLITSADLRLTGAGDAPYTIAPPAPDEDTEPHETHRLHRRLRAARHGRSRAHAARSAHRHCGGGDP